MNVKYNKVDTYYAATIHWNPKDKADRKLAETAVKELLRQGYWYSLDSDVLMSKTKSDRRDPPPSSFFGKNDFLDMDDLLLQVAGSEDLASILDYLAHIGACPQMYTTMRRKGKKQVRYYKIIVGAFSPIEALHTNITQAAIDAVFLWDQKGRPK